MNKYLPQRINSIEEYTPSEAIYAVRLDANECPFNVPPEILKQFQTAVENIDFNRYPDSCAKALISEFCAVFGCRPECTVAGCGSDELISLLLNTLLDKNETVVVTKPDFSMYSFYASLIGCKIFAAGKYDDGGIDFDALRDTAINQNARLVIFSNPCNPTGRAYDRETILKLVDSLDCVVIVDEAYMEFCRPGCSVLGDTGERENLIVLKTLSKAFGAAAIRVGFSVSQPDICAAIKKVKSPYNLNSVSQEFGRILLSNHTLVERRLKVIRAEVKRMSSMLSAIISAFGGKIADTDANFILASFADERAPKFLYEYLKDNSIIIRFPDPRHLRITCGTEDEILRLVTALTMAYNEYKQHREKNS